MGDAKLSEEKLYECLKSLNVPVRLNDLKSPTKDFMIRVFECFLKDFHIDIRDQRMLFWESERCLEYPEVSEDARMLTLLLISINFFTQQDGLTIKLKDITEPKPKRTKKVLHFLLVFWNYCLRNYACIQSIEEGLQEEKEKIDKIIEENSSLEEQYEKCVHALQEKDPNKELNQIVAFNNDKLKELSVKKEADIVLYQEMKTTEQDLMNKIATAETNIISTKDSITELDQCIVTSPERFTADISKLKEAIKNEELQVKEKDLELKEKMKMLEGLMLAQEENAKAVELLQKIESTYAELSNTANIFVQETQKNKKLEETLEKMKEELIRKKEEKYSFEEESVHVQLNQNKRLEEFTETLQTLQKDVAEEKELLTVSKTSTTGLMSKIDKEADNILEIVERCQQAEEETEKAHRIYSNEMEAISTQFRNDCEDIKSKVVEFFKT